MIFVKNAVGIKKSHVFTVSFWFERQIAEEGSRGATRATAPRRGLRVAALGNPYRSGYENHEKNTIMKQTETTEHPKNPSYKRKSQQATAHEES
ncbi:hypothetical protein RCS94_09240 [Orbaceae bacterium ac157xtp]